MMRSQEKKVEILKMNKPFKVATCEQQQNNNAIMYTRKALLHNLKRLQFRYFSQSFFPARAYRILNPEVAHSSYEAPKPLKAIPATVLFVPQTTTRQPDMRLHIAQQQRPPPIKTNINQGVFLPQKI